MNLESQTKQNSEAGADELPDASTEVAASPCSDDGASKKEGARLKEPVVVEKTQRVMGKGKADKGDAKPEFEFTPSAPAWMPGGVATDVPQEKISPIAVPPGDKADGTSASASSKEVPEESGENLEGGSVTSEPGVRAAELNP